MASKPRSEWSEAYRRRMESAERRGLTGAAKRGHKAHEHIERRAKEKAKTGYTPSQNAQIRAFGIEKARRASKPGKPPVDEKEAIARIKKWTDRKGYEAFKELKAANRALTREKRRQSKIIRAEGGGAVELHISSGGMIAEMQRYKQELELPEMPDGDDLGWLYYPK